MILKYEIEKFIQEIENKLPKLDGKAYDSAKDKIAILNRVNIEFMDYEDVMRKVSIQNSKIKIAWLEQKKEIIKLSEKVNRLEDELETVKKNING
jgi:archaellum component FlaC